MNEKIKKHHDYRPKTWQVSLSDEEFATAEARRETTGLTKAAFGRQALTKAKVVSRVSKVDQKALADLSHMRADINRIVMICEKNGAEKALKRITEIDDMFTKIYNYLLTKV